MPRRKRAQFLCPCCGIEFRVKSDASGMVSVECTEFIINPEFYPDHWEETGTKGNIRQEGVPAGMDAKKGGDREGKD